MVDVKNIINGKGLNSWFDFIKRLFKEKPFGAFGLVVMVIMILTAVFAPVIAPYEMNETSTDTFLGPTSGHIFGTDNLGRDLFSRMVYGSQISIAVAFGGTFVAMFISLIIGVTSGYFGGKFDLIMQRIVDGWMCFPALILLIALISIVGSGLWQVLLVLGIQRGISGSRVIRSAVIGIKGNMYIMASQSIGASKTRMMMRHILPNIMGIAITLFTTRLPGMVLGEASLSFLGFGVPPPAPSWGGMLSFAGRQYMLMNPWIAIWPGLILSVVVFGANMFGDAIRDLLDPRLKGGSGRYTMKNKKISEIRQKALIKN